MLSVVTSKVDDVKLRRKTCPETLVEIAPDDFQRAEENRPSWIATTSNKFQLTEFNAQFVCRKIRYFDKDLPVALRKALRKAIHASNILTAEMKALVAKP